jgi:CPA2 family monovalent cation:H+ antiporter-2
MTTLSGHVVLVGYGRVGRNVCEVLQKRNVPLVVAEMTRELVEQVKDDGAHVLVGNAAQPDVLAAANLAEARCLLVAIPHAFEAGQIIEQARAINPELLIVARSHSDAETEHLQQLGASITIMGEREISKAMMQQVFEADTPARRWYDQPNVQLGLEGA